MIVTEYYKTRADGVVLNRTYSDSGYMVERDGIRYSEAIDPAEFNRQYTETDEPIEVEDMTETEMKASAYDILVGDAK
jgi:hypothetical protein